MDFRTQRLCAWAGVASNFIFYVGVMPLAHLNPPTPPSWDAQHVAAFYQGNQAGVRLGLMVMMVGISLLIPFFCCVAAQVKRIEGEVAPLTYTILVSAAIGLVPVFSAMTLWATAAFRPDRSPELILMMSDLAWIGLIFVVAPPMLLLIAVGLAVVRDRSADPVFPKWVGYFSFLCAVASGTGLDVINHKDGPFAWNGALGFYLSASIFAGVWVFVMAWQTLRSIKRHERRLA